MTTSRELRKIDYKSAEKIPDITRRIVENFDPVKLVLFGSQARGEGGPHSDIDLLVVLEEIDDKWATTVAIRKSLRGIGAPVDVILSTPSEIQRRGSVVGTILHTALREGRVLYAR